MIPKTTQQKPADVRRSWHLIDAEGQILGRLATRIASHLSGKTKPTYTPHVDGGDSVIVVNAEKIKVTGTKLKTKIYQRYSGYPSGLKKEPLEHLLARRPTEVLRHAVAGMLPKNRLGNQMARRLRIYAGPQHPHTGQLAGTQTKAA
ncbi:MAG: 50S ribosomal protein L13 [Candidatus Omnitrophica bacterium CG11_big_fil_rev_8_21_14_0_20_64_10]|nr:MAG: 50S ribosomal protein L13 [Candidatus Omnitrophica bacterium CG11_big_fil_rev_8_21_14_0_20_64_10]